MTLVLLNERILAIIDATGGHAEPAVVVDGLSLHTSAPFARSAIAMAIRDRVIRQGPLGLLEAVPARTGGAS